MSNTNLLFQCLLGMQFKDFAIVAADMNNTQSVIIMKDDEDKIKEVSNNLLVGVNGDSGDTNQFIQFVTKNIQLYKLRNRYELGAPAAVHFTRKNMADALHNGTPFILNMLIGGYDEENGGQLYTVDFLASCVRVPYAAHGLGGLLSFCILDRYYKPTLSEVEAYEVIKLCVREIKQRLLMNLPNFGVKIVSKHGIKTLPTISPASFIHY